MARLRKPSPLEPSIFSQRPDQSQPTRCSPRKAVREVSYIISSDEDEEEIPLRPKPSKHNLRGPSPILRAESICTSKLQVEPIPLCLTPRKQRILRPVESNSRLLRKMSEESLASPEKRPESERRAREDISGKDTADLGTGRHRNLMYARNLARSLAGRELKKASSRMDVLDDAERSQQITTQKKSVAVENREYEDEFNEEASILCGDGAIQVEEQRLDGEDVEDSVSEEREGGSEEHKEALTPPVRRRHRRRQRCIKSDSESGHDGLGKEEAEKQAEQGKEQLNGPQPLMSVQTPHRKGPHTISNWVQGVIDLTDSPQAPDSCVLPGSTRAHSSSFAVSRPATSSSEGAQPFLTYSPTPTKQRSPCKAPPVVRPATPPHVVPSTIRLISPSKKKPLIPQAPDMRQSLDAFWNPEIVNNWNDHHSPAKKLVSPRKQQWRDDICTMMGGMDLEDTSSGDEAYTSPASGPGNEVSRSRPRKKLPAVVLDTSVKQVRARKSFAENRNDIATSFLAELDNAICSGTISKLSEATGGIKILWSNTLKTTAGRANWRREVIRVKTSSAPPMQSTETRHHCSIELATKIIDDSSRLYNVLAHEFCHLLTFMVSEVRNNPHGAEFKSWGRKVSAAFAEKGVEVTTKHSYTIEYRFVWECITCGYEFKRHSRSIDTTRHSCGKCRGKLVQTRPVPRKGGMSQDRQVSKPSEYQNFVKDNFRRVKQDMIQEGLETPLGRVIEHIAKQYKEQKKQK